MESDRERAQAIRGATRAPSPAAALTPIVRRVIKGSVERVLVSSIVTSVTRQRLRGKSLILAYHAIVPDAARERDVGERSLYVTQRRFAEQLDIIAACADVVPLDQLGDRCSGERPRVAITFDDAYQGAVTCAIDELESRRLPATIFVAPGYLGAQVFWWDALAHRDGEMAAHVRTHALEVLKGSGPAITQWAADNGHDVRTDLPAYAKSATTGELLAAAHRPGVTLGSHSWSHANLARLAREELTDELGRSRDWLMSHAASKYVPHLAYPYGLESPLARDMAVTTGYASALCITGGWHHAEHVPPFARPRLNIGAGMSLNGFRARLLGSLRT